MSYMQKLYETYDNNMFMAGKSVENKQPLIPVSHMVTKAQIEITITDNGEILDAVVVSKENSETLIPVTEASAGRSSGAAPHPLCDTISYISKDFVTYSSDNSKTSKVKAKSDAYLNELGAWAEWEYAHYKVRAVYAYCSKGNVVQDLIRFNVLKVDEYEKLSKDKIEGQEYEKCLVRWRVLSGQHISDPKETWLDSRLFDNYTKYIVSTFESAKKDVCYVTGDSVVVASQHPKAIVRLAGNAKLISSNDSLGYTYRGRFSNSDEACIVGYEVSQKAHNALKWVIVNQGQYYGSRMVTCWSSGKGGKALPNFDSVKNSEEDDEEEDIKKYSNTMAVYRKVMYEFVNGYRQNFDMKDDACVIALDAATPGRLSVTYYNELPASDYLERILKWRTTCCWYRTKFTQDKKPFLEVATPDIKSIIKNAFGTERGQFIELDEKILKEHSQRIIVCIFENQPVPRDIIHGLVIRASTPLAYSRSNWEKILFTACALIHRKQMELTEDNIEEREDTGMELNGDETDRSFLFGRLLAIAEKVERNTYSSDERGRQPNAIRYWAAFSNHPLHTWRILEEQLIPYYQKQKPEYLTKIYKDMISEIVILINDTDVNILDKALDDTYLLGYYLQRKEFSSFGQSSKDEEGK